MINLSHLLTKNDVLEQIEALYVFVLRQVLEYVASLRVDDADGLGQVVSLHYAALGGVQGGQHGVGGHLQFIAFDFFELIGADISSYLIVVLLYSKQ